MTEREAAQARFGPQADSAYVDGLRLLQETKKSKSHWRVKRRFERAIEEGEHVGAMCELALLLHGGAPGVRKRVRRAERLAKQALEKCWFLSKNAFRNRGELSEFVTQAPEVHQCELDEHGRLMDVDSGTGAPSSALAQRLYLRAVAEGGTATTCNLIGLLFERGSEGVPRDLARARDLYAAASSVPGNSLAKERYGHLLENGGPGVPKKPRLAVDLYTSAIDQTQSPDAMVALGLLLERGADGVCENPTMAAELYSEAARLEPLTVKLSLPKRSGGRGFLSLWSSKNEEHCENLPGSAMPVYLLGCLLLKGGRRFQKDERGAREKFIAARRIESNLHAMYALAMCPRTTAEDAFFLFQDASKAGCPKATYQAAKMLDKHLYTKRRDNARDVRGAVELYEEYLRKEDDGSSFSRQAKLRLARILYEGSEEVSRNPVRAVKLLQELVDSSDERGMLELGKIRKHGDGTIAMDLPEALKLFERASEAGNTAAAYQAAKVLHGSGNLARARLFYEACLKCEDNVKAIIGLATTFTEGRAGGPGDLKNVVQLLERAVRDSSDSEGVASARYTLGLFYRDGRGTVKDSDRAYTLFSRAASAGHPDALFEAAVLTEDGPPGVRQSTFEAEQKYQKCIDRYDNVSAMVRLAQMWHRSELEAKKAVKLYERAINKGAGPEARRPLAMLLWDGAEGVTRDARYAIALMKTVVDEDSNPVDKVRLADWLSSEDAGTLQDVAQAKKLVKEAQMAQVSLPSGTVMKKVLAMSKREMPSPGPARYDVFISHAGPDKKTVAYHIREALERNGLRCFLDELDMVGSSRTAEEQLFSAMNGSRAAIFILSLEFSSRRWPMKELLHFLERRRVAKENNQRPPLLMAIFYSLSVRECKDAKLYSKHPEIFRRNEFFQPERLQECSKADAMRALSTLAGLVGIGDDTEGAGPEFAASVAPKIIRAFIQEFGQPSQAP